MTGPVDDDSNPGPDSGHGDPPPKNPPKQGGRTAPIPVPAPNPEPTEKKAKK